MCRPLILLAVVVLALILNVVDAKPNRKAAGKLKGGVNLRRSPDPTMCDPDKLMVYKITLVTHWSREHFPKQYPEWRPPAQWSKLIGRSHDANYVLFRTGQLSSDGFKEFSETGKSDALDAQSQGEGGIFDEFNSPPITAGEGKSEAEFFVDSNHSRVSLASRIVPSPDWFIGLDSFNLCIDGQWVDSVAIKVGPMDAGTDNGFTFTSPNWPSVPSEKIFRITSQLPNHPANSFYYPDMNELPAIATFFFVKVKEYELAEIFETVTLPPPTPEETAPTTTSTSTTTTTAAPQTTTATTTTTAEAATAAAAATATTGFYEDQVTGEDDQNNNETLRKKVKKLATKSKSGLLKSFQNLKLDNSEFNRKQRAQNNRRGRKTANLSGPRHCMVSEWGQWSACSKSCGIGESTRTRKVLTHARRGGNPCPPLEENKWCGSSRDCKQAYFDW